MSAEPAGASAPSTERGRTIRFAGEPTIQTYYPGQVAKFIDPRTGKPLLIRADSAKGQAILRGEYGEASRQEIMRQLSEQESRPNITGTEVVDLPAPSATRTTTAASALKPETAPAQTMVSSPPDAAYRPNVAAAGYIRAMSRSRGRAKTANIAAQLGQAAANPTVRVLVIAESRTSEDLFLAKTIPGPDANIGRAISNWYKDTITENHLTVEGLTQATTAATRFAAEAPTYRDLLVMNIPSCIETAEVLFPGKPIKLLDSYLSDARQLIAHDIGYDSIVILNREQYSMYIPSETRQLPLDAFRYNNTFEAPTPANTVTIPGIAATIFTAADRPSALEEEQTADSFLERIPAFVKNISQVGPHYLTALRQLLQEYLLLIGEPRVRKEAIIAATRSQLLVKTLQQIVSDKGLFTDKTIAQRNTIFTLFVKLFSAQTEVLIREGVWPLEGYDTTLPDPAILVGFQYESMASSGFRQFNMFYSKSKDKSLNKSTFLARMNQVASRYSDATDKINHVHELSALTRSEYQKETNKYRLIDTVMLENRDPFDRFIIGTSSGSKNYADYLLRLNFSNYPSEFASDNLSGNFVSPVLGVKYESPAQQIFLLLPHTLTADTINDVENQRDIFPDLKERTAWIIPKIALNDPADPSRYKTSDSQAGGLRIQGQTLFTQPPVEVLRVLWEGVKEMSEHTRKLLPELQTLDGCRYLVQRCVKEYEKRTAALPQNNEYQKLFKLLHTDTIRLIHKIIPDLQDKPYPNPMRAPGAAEALQHQTVPAVESGIPAMLSRVNMNANKDPNAAYTRFNRNVRPFLKVPTANIQTRKRGFWSGESKDTYRRTLKRQLYKLMRVTGTGFTYEDAIAELRYIYEQLAENPTVPETVVYERMKDWSTRYVSDMPAAYRVQLRRENPEGLARLDQIASLFATVSPPSARMILPEAIRMAHPMEMSSRKESMEAAIRRVVFSPKLIRGKALYDEIRRIVDTYPDVVRESQALKSAVAQVTVPPQRGFLARTFGGRNVAYNTAIQTAAQRVLSALEQTAVPIRMSVGKAEPQPPLVAAPPASPAANIGLSQVIVKRPKEGTAGARRNYTYLLETRRSNRSVAESVPLSNIATNEEARSEYPGIRLEERQGGGGNRKTARLSRMRKGQKTRKGNRKQMTRKQHGGAATPMPLGWYQPGGQFIGTTSEPTGVGLAGSNASWARLPLAAQSGGRRRQQQGGFHGLRQGVADQQGGFHGLRQGVADQQGGFTPSIMGAGFAEAGMRLLPAAAYMGYNQFNNYRKEQRKTHRKGRK